MVVGGDSDESERYIAPTIITNVSEEDGIMKEEVFGPLLPVLVVDDFQKAIEFVKRGYMCESVCVCVCVCVCV